MQIIEITSANDPRLAVYSTLTEAQLRNRLEPEKGIFIADVIFCVDLMASMRVRNSFKPAIYAAFSCFAKNSETNCS